MAVQVSLFRHARDNSPEMRQYGTWEELVAELGGHRVQPGGDKLSQPALSPAEYPQGAARASANVRRVHFIMLDFDKLSASQLDDVLGAAEGHACVLYTTWSHPARHLEDGSWSFRLVMKLDRPVELGEWSRFFRRLRARFKNLPDRKCSDPSRIYFGPASPSHDGNVLEVQHGRPVCVADVLADGEPDPSEPQQLRRVNREDLAALAASLSRRAATKGTGRMLAKAVAGEPFAEPGSRDESMFRIANAVAESWPDVDPGSAASVLAPAVAAMQAVAPDCPGPDVLEDKVRRAVRRLEEEQERLAKERKDAVRAMILDAFDGARSDPYSEDELAQFAAEAKTTQQGFRRRWIVQLARSFYFFKSGSYLHPVPWDTMITRAERELAPATSAGVTVWKADANGQPRLKTIQELMIEYGTVADLAVADMTAVRSRYDAKSGTIIEAPCPPRELQPQESPAVAEWLRLFAGEELESLLTWIAALGFLDQPCGALYLDGVRGVGKSMFAQGLSRLWTVHGPTALEDVSSAFNDGLQKCPLVFGDEVLPDVLKKTEGTGYLRQLIQARRHTLRRKYLPTATITGSVRLLLAANNIHMLDTYEHLTPADIEAIKERVLYIKTNPKAADFLREVGRDGWNEMVEGDGIARHALWIRETHPVNRNRRFIVTGKTSDLHRALSTGQGLASAVCHWCVNYLLEPGKMDALGTLLVRISKGRLLVQAKGLSDHWEMYTTNVRSPAAGRIQRSLSALAENRKVQMTGWKGRRQNYWEIKGENLLQWANDHGYCTEDELLDALNTDTNIPGMPDPQEDCDEDEAPF